MTEAPRRRPRGETRERILVAALELFVERGYDGTSLTDIERAVGLTPGTGSFYRHFPGKEAVLVASVEHGVAELVAQAFTERTDLGAITDAVDRRRADLASRYRDMARFQPIWGLVTAERQRFPELARIFLRGLRMDVWDAGWSTDRAGAVAFAAMVGYAQLELLGDGPFRSVAPEEFLATAAALLTPAPDPVE